MKSLVFTAESHYARFRCPHTTTSALTFLTIHPLAVKGLIGAILGVDYGDIYKYTEEMKIGIQVLNPVYKDMQSFNLIAQTNNNGAANFQSRVQFLRDVKYRIFVIDNEDKLELISKALKSHEYVFTPYLGCSEHIAYLNLEGIFDTELSDGELVDTLVPKDYIKLDLNGDFHIYVERIPVKNNKDREYIDYSKVMFAVGNRVGINKCSIYKVGDYNAFYF